MSILSTPSPLGDPLFVVILLQLEKDGKFRRSQRCLQELRLCVDKDKTDHVVGVRTRVDPYDRTASRPPDEHIGTGYPGCGQQGMEIRDVVQWRGRLRY